MHVGEQHPGPADPPSAPSAQEAQSRQAPPGPARAQVRGVARLATRRWWVSAASAAVVTVVLYVLLVRISMSWPMNSDGANNALQAWDMIHGHVLLPGWIIGDASVATFELPLYGIVELVTGLHGVIFHLVAGLTYLIVTGFAAALAAAGSRGAAAVARCGAVIAVLAVPVLTDQGVSILLAAPNHTGTAVFLLAAFLLIDRAPAWRFTPPLLALILCAGELGDATVLYIAVPAVIVVCGYRMAAARRIRSADGAAVVAAVVSLPLEYLIHTLMRHLGGYVMVQPKNAIAPPGEWPAHLVITFRAIRTLFGAFGAEVVPAHTSLSGLAGVFGVACLLAAVFGFGKAVSRWTAASRAEQLACAAIVINLGAYTVSTLPTTYSSREVVAVLPLGAVLAARACVPSRIASADTARLTVTAAALAAAVPLALAAVTLPPSTPPAAPLAAFLQAHRLTYGIGGYWDSSAVTLESHDQVQVRAVVSVTAQAYKPGAPAALWFGPGKLAPFYWEAKASWYDPSQHNATFVIANGQYPDTTPLSSAEVEYAFGAPAAAYQVAGREIMVYRTNLLRRLAPPLLPGPLGNGL